MMMTKITKTYNLKERTLRLINLISIKEDETMGSVIDRAVEYYAVNRYGYKEGDDNEIQ